MGMAAADRNGASLRRRFGTGWGEEKEMRGDQRNKKVVRLPRMEGVGRGYEFLSWFGLRDWW